MNKSKKERTTHRHLAHRLLRRAPAVSDVLGSLCTFRQFASRAIMKTRVKWENTAGLRRTAALETGLCGSGTWQHSLSALGNSWASPRVHGDPGGASTARHWGLPPPTGVVPVAGWAPQTWR